MPRQMSAPSRAHAPPAGSSHPAGRLQKLCLWLGVAALLTQSGFRNLLWTCAVIGAPVATAGFVYQVVAMHQARSRHEFVANAVETLSRETPEPDLIDVKVTAPSLADARPERDLRMALFAMLIARSRFIDIFGPDPASITPAFRRTALSMLNEDEQMFRQLQAERQKDLDLYLLDWRMGETRLRILNVQLKKLVQRPASPAARPSR